MIRPTIAEGIARAAESQRGKREATANRGQDLQPFFDADNYDPNGPKPGDDGYAWCAAFVCWAVYQAVKDLKLSWKRPVTPGAWKYEAWARAQNECVELKKPHHGDIQRGDILVFGISHIGIATGPPDAAGRVSTIEGNTSGTSDGNQREGDGVFAKSRHLSAIRSRIRIHEEGSEL